MPLDTSRMVLKGALLHDDIKQYANLLTGVMVDQPVTIANNLLVGGVISGKGSVPAGGTVSQVLGKISGTDYVLGWIDQTGTGGGGSTSGYHEEFVPAAAATTVVLAVEPSVVLTVARDGVVQSELGGDYSLTDSTLTFSDAFTGTERVIVAYLSGTAAGPGIDLDLRTYVGHLMEILDPSGPPPPAAVMLREASSTVDVDLRTYMQHVMAIIDPSGPPAP